MRLKRDNYAIQADQARQLFLTYDQQTILNTTPATSDAEYLYIFFACAEYRIRRADGHLFRRTGEAWLPADSHGEVLTLFDYLCDAKPRRHAAGEYATIASLGRHVHSELASRADELDHAIEADPDRFRAACRTLGGTEARGGDISFTLKLFPDVTVLARFWHADEDFPPKLDLLWDKNILLFLRYETVWFAAGLLRRRILEAMRRPVL